MAIPKPVSKKKLSRAVAAPAKPARTPRGEKAAPARPSSRRDAAPAAKPSRRDAAAPARTPRGEKAAPAPVKKGAFGRPAGAPGAVRKGPPRKKPIKFVFKAQPEYKSCFVEVTLATDKDGFIAPGILVEAIKGKWDNENAPRYDLVRHDPDTAMTLVSRISMLMYVTNQAKRLTANKEYIILVRVSVSKAKKQEIRAGIKTIWTENAKGKLVEMDKKDPECRRFRRCGRFLAPSFAQAIDMVELKELEKEYQQQLDAAADDGDED